MQNDNKLFSDIAKMMSGAAGTVAGMSREAADNARERTREWIAGLDFVSREEFETVKDMAARAREENEALKARIEKLESAVGKAAGK